MRFLRKIFQRIIRELEQHERLTTTVLALIVGLMAGYGAILFRILLDFVLNFHLGTVDNTLEVFSNYQWWQRMIPPLLGLSVVVPLIHYVARETAGSGIPQTMEAILLRGGFIRARAVVTKLIVTALTLGSGGSAGYEGPLVQVGAGASSVLGQLTHASYRRMRILLASGAAAAIAATFNAPIAGVLFAVEVMVSEYTAMTLSPIVIASVIATAISRAYLGDAPAILIPENLQTFQFSSGVEIGTFLLLGLITGLLAVLFNNSVFRVTDFFRNMKLHIIAKGIIGASIVAVFVALVPNVAGSGYETVDGLFRDDIAGLVAPQSLLAFLGEHLWLVIILMFGFKLLATAVTIGMGASGGIFGPTLFLGAASGYSIGQYLEMLMPNWVSDPAYYAMVGMGAFAAGATHTPMASIIILFEMTGDYKIILPLMLACVFSTLIASRLDEESFFTRQLARKGINIRQGREEKVLAGIRVNDIMQRDYEVLPHTLRYDEIMEVFRKSRGIYFPVVDDSNRLLGVLRFYDLRGHMFEPGLEHLVIARDLVTPDVVTLTPEENLLTAFEKFNTKDIEQIPVVDSREGKHILGMLSRQDLINAYNKAVLNKSMEVEEPHEEEIHP